MRKARRQIPWTNCGRYSPNLTTVIHRIGDFFLNPSVTLVAVFSSFGLRGSCGAQKSGKVHVVTEALCSQ